MFVVSSSVSSPPSLFAAAYLSTLFTFFFFVSSFVALSHSSNYITNNNATSRSKSSPVHHQLTLDFYSSTCPQLDDIVSTVTAARFKESPVSAPATIRLFFHDCFVEGCDASILLEPGSEGSTLVEKEMPENKNLAPEGFQTIKLIKMAVESKCPGAVTCADILAIAARDFIHLVGGPYYPVKKGRKDSKASKPSKVKYNLPTSNSTLNHLIQLFASKGLTKDDLVALSGAHSIGFAHCDQFLPRLYNYRRTNKPDPLLDPQLLKELQLYCPRYGGNDDIVAPLDVQTPFLFDHAYYGNLQKKLGLLETDQELYMDYRTKTLADGFGKDKQKFFVAFVLAMEKMGSIKIKKGKKGEIRRDCSRHLSNTVY